VPSLKKMRARTDQFKVAYAEEDTTVTWLPGLLTMRFEERLQDLYDEWRSGQGRASAALRELREQLAKLIVEWDLTEDEGPVSESNPMVPITAEKLADLPEGFTGSLVDRLMEEAAGGKARQPSGGGGPAGGQLAKPQSGPHSFG